MSVDKIVMFTCDICGEVDYFITNSIQQARQQAKKNGTWKFIKGKDICIDCIKERVKE